MLIISSKLAKFLGLCDSGTPAEIFCVVIRRKTTPFFSSSYSSNLPSQQCDTSGLLEGSTAFIQSSLHLDSRHSAKIVVSSPETSLLPSSQYRSPRKGVKRSLSFSHIPCRGVDASNSGGRTYRSASCCEKRPKRETPPTEVFINERIHRESVPGVENADAHGSENRSINEMIPSCSDSTLSVEAFQAPNSKWAANDNMIENLKRFVCNTVNFKKPLLDLRSGDFYQLESEIQSPHGSQATKLEATCIPLADFQDSGTRHLQEPQLGGLNLQQRQTFQSTKLESTYNPLGDFQNVNTISSSNSMPEGKESCETQIESSVKVPTTEHAGQQAYSAEDDLPLTGAIVGQNITLPLTPISVPTEVKYCHLTSGKSSMPSIDYERSCENFSGNSIDEKYSRNYETENEKVQKKHSSALSTSAMYGVTAIQASVTLHSAQDKSKDSPCATDIITSSSSDKEQFDKSVLVSSQSQSTSDNKAMISILPKSPFNAQDMSSSKTVESKREIENYIPSLPTTTDVERGVAPCEQLDADVVPSFSFMYSMKSHKVCIDRLRLLQDALKASSKGSAFDANSKARNPRPVIDSFCKEDFPSSVKTKEDPFALSLESTEDSSAKADSSKNYDTPHSSQTSSQRHNIVLDKKSWPCQGGAIEMSLNKDWGFSANVDDHEAKLELKSCDDPLCCSDGLASKDGDGPAEELSLTTGLETKAVECAPQDQLKAHTVRERVQSCDNSKDVGGRKGIEPDGKGGGRCCPVEEQGQDFISKMEPCSRLSSSVKLSSDRFECEASSQGECCTNETAEIELETTESVAAEPKRLLSPTVNVKEEVSPLKVLLHEIDDVEALNNRKRPANASSSFKESLLSNKSKVDTHQEKQLMADVAVVVGKHSTMNQKKNQRRPENEEELFKRRRNATIYQSRKRAESFCLPPPAPPPLAYFNTGWKRGREVPVNNTRGIGLRRYHSGDVRFNNQFPIPYVDNAMNWELLRTGGNQRCYPYCNDPLPLHNRGMNHLWHCLMLDGLRWLPWR
ncbi:PREDICTED: uncharacterized protein LOC107342445 [Acropora digitifera]|uniref:uncharacterized protein LOC107342445 n=1 Tax=Acropora digitifera TaxID=70779 RepID=UPI00077AF7C6|nr:PREDICTED: uncharacterized protein LOC107342445 [Acropora digitifera]